MQDARLHEFFETTDVDVTVEQIHVEELILEQFLVKCTSPSDVMTPCFSETEQKSHGHEVGRSKVIGLMPSNAASVVEDRLISGQSTTQALCGICRPEPSWRNCACVGENVAWGKRAWRWDSRVYAAYENERRQRACEELRREWEHEEQKVKAAREARAAERRASRKERRAEETRRRIAAEQLERDRARERWCKTDIGQVASVESCEQLHVQDSVLCADSSVEASCDFSNRRQCVQRKSACRRQLEKAFFRDRCAYGYARGFGARRRRKAPDQAVGECFLRFYCLCLCCNIFEQESGSPRTDAEDKSVHKTMRRKPTECLTQGVQY